MSAEETVALTSVCTAGSYILTTPNVAVLIVAEITKTRSFDELFVLKGVFHE